MPVPVPFLVTVPTSAPFLVTILIADPVVVLLLVPVPDLLLLWFYSATVLVPVLCQFLICFCSGSVPVPVLHLLLLLHVRSPNFSLCTHSSTCHVTGLVVRGFQEGFGARVEGSDESLALICLY